jgi:hypothetical protein
MIFKFLISQMLSTDIKYNKKKLNLKLFFNGYYSVLIVIIKLFF